MVTSHLITKRGINLPLRESTTMFLRGFVVKKGQSGLKVTLGEQGAAKRDHLFPDLGNVNACHVLTRIRTMVATCRVRCQQLGINSVCGYLCFNLLNQHLHIPPLVPSSVVLLTLERALRAEVSR